MTTTTRTWKPSDVPRVPKSYERERTRPLIKVGRRVAVLSADGVDTGHSISGSIEPALGGLQALARGCAVNVAGALARPRHSAGMACQRWCGPDSDAGG